MKLRKLILTLSVATLGLVACSNSNDSTSSVTPTTTSETPTTSSVTPTTSTNPYGTSLTYSQYMAAEDGTEVVIEGYIQARRTWYNGAVLYLQDDDGAYFIYNLPCTQTEYNEQLLVGNKIQVKGKKGSWGGEVEILANQSGAEAEWALLSGTKTYDAKSITLSEAEANQNQFVSYTNLIIQDVYEEGRNVYYLVTDGTKSYTFCVETYMESTPKTSTTYTTVAALSKGDIVDVKGYQYIYYTPQLHTTEVTKKSGNAFDKAEGVLTYSEYIAKSDGETVTISGYIDNKQSWWSNKASLYLSDKDGGYFIYNLPCTENEYNTDLVIGNKITVTGYKTSWHGEVEIDGSRSGSEAEWTVDSTIKYIENPVNYTSLLSNKTELLKHNNQKVEFKNLEVVSVTEPTSDNGDIYYVVKYTADDNTEYTYTFCVESYLTDKTTDVYKTVLALSAGDKINVTGYLYAYNDPQLHTLTCTKVA